MELNEAMRTTFAARDYTGEPISDEVLYEVIDNARFAPSGGNRQGNRVIIVRDQATKTALSKLAEPGARQYVAQIGAGENPWNSVVPTSLSDEAIAAVEVPDLLVKPFLSADAVLVFLVDLNVVASTDQLLDRVGVISGASIYPFVWNVLLGIRQAGFGGTINTMTGPHEAEVQDLLNIPQHFAVAATVPIGKPVKQLTRLKRAAVDQIAVRESFDGEPFTIAGIDA